MDPSRIAIVTGATRLAGIGAAIAAELAADGWSLLLVGYEPYDRAQEHTVPADGLQAVAERVSTRHTAPMHATGSQSSAGSPDSKGSADSPAPEQAERSIRIETLACDLSDPESAETVLQTCLGKLGPPTTLVNNAAVSEPGGIDDIDGAQLDGHWAVNARAPMLLTAAFSRAFREAFPRVDHGAHAGGSVVNLSSGQSAGPMPGELAYAASKGALEAFTLSAAASLAPFGIRVNAVDPGPTDTGWMTTRQRKALVAPLGRVGQPEDAARLVRYLCSADSRWITGQVLRSRGGL